MKNNVIKKLFFVSRRNTVVTETIISTCVLESFLSDAVLLLFFVVICNIMFDFVNKQV